MKTRLNNALLLYGKVIFPFMSLFPFCAISTLHFQPLQKLLSIIFNHEGGSGAIPPMSLSGGHSTCECACLHVLLTSHGASSPVLARAAPAPRLLHQLGYLPRQILCLSLRCCLGVHSHCIFSTAGTRKAPALPYLLHFPINLVL